MVELKISLKKKHLAVFILVVGVLGFLMFARAYDSDFSGGDPAMFGHSSNEIDVDLDGDGVVDKSLQQAIIDGDLSGGSAPAQSPWVASGNDIYYPGGLVGVGDFSGSPPLEVLDVAGNLFVRGNNLFMTSSQRTSLHSAGGDLYVNPNNAFPDVLINVGGSGNVGIGTATPSEKLDVSGNIGASGDITANKLIAPELNIPSTGDVFIQGLLTGSDIPLHIGSNGRLVKAGSSERYKSEIRDLTFDAELVPKLRPVSFVWNEKSADYGKEDFGLIAEEVYSVFPELVSLDSMGRPENVRYQLLSVLLLDVVKEQENEIEQLKEAVCGINPSSVVCD